MRWPTAFWIGYESVWERRDDVLFLAIGVVLTVVGTATCFYPALAGTPWMWLAFGVSQAPLAIVALKRMKDSGELREMLQPRWGDISMGMGSSLLLLAASWGMRTLMAPEGSPREAWLLRAYLQAGDPKVLQAQWPVIAAAIIGLAFLAEAGWRGLIFPELEVRLGSRLAWPVTGVAYGLAFAPSAWWLRDSAGLNVLVPMAATAGGLIWGFLAARTRRLTPSMMSHAVFLWFVVVQFRVLSLGE